MTLTAQQLEMRRTGFGGSDIAAIAGLEPYSSPTEVWLRVTGRSRPFDGNRFTHWGNRLEAVIADEYADRHRVDLRPSGTLRHPERAWQIGTPDRLVFLSKSASSPARGLECKARSIRQAHLWGPDGSGDIPPSVEAQTRWYMSLTGLPRWDVAVLIAGNDFRSYRVDRDEERERELLEAGLRFWTDHILADRPPPVDGSDAARRYLESLMPSRPHIVPAPVEAERLGKRLLELRAASKAEDAERSLLENQLCALLTAAAADGFAGDWGRFTWREERGRVAWKKVAEDLGCSDSIVEKHRGAPCRVSRLTVAEGQ